MSLEEYKKKRDFSKSPEPEPELSQDFCEKIVKKIKLNLPRPVYVIQEHHAKRLHWDLRLEINNVLKSWAIPKGPSNNPKEKRLAIETEDHPLEYAMFEGEIPKGNYGAGKVKIWDRGTFDLIEKTKDKIVVEIKGKKLKGKYVLLKFKKNNWLFFKKRT